MAIPETQLAKMNGSQAAGTIARQDFGGSELAVAAETASTAAAAQARAAVEARYVMALRRPRDLLDVRARLLRECERPGFADAAIYSKPMGGKSIEGPSVRFAEAAIRCMTNILAETATVYDDGQKRIVRVSVTDLESNVTYPKDVVIQKTVERLKLKDDQEPISVRTNSYGKRTYLVPATDDELLNKENALTSKALRTSGLRLLPGDILDECMAKCRAVLNDRAAKDPAAETKKLVDAFMAVNVLPSDLAEYLGHPADRCVPSEIVGLRALYQTIRDGETSWREVLAAKEAAPATAPPEQPAQAADEPPKETPAAPAEAAPQPPPSDPLLDAMLAAKSLKELQEVGKKIRAVTNEAKKEEYRVIYQARATEIQKAEVAK
jgi:hypothetical protein